MKYGSVPIQYNSAWYDWSETELAMILWVQIRMENNGYNNNGHMIARR